MIKFEVGKTYATRSICDYDCIFSFTILARTAKTVTVEVHGKRVKRGLSAWGNAERFKPFGSYSMAPTIAADRPATATAKPQEANIGSLDDGYFWNGAID